MQEMPDYNAKQAGEHKAICELLYKTINATLPKAESKIWYAAPVWFRDGNPLVGYTIRKAGVELLFWSGQGFEEIGLRPEGKFKAAAKTYQITKDISITDLKRWLKKSWAIQWDYKNIVSKKGKLDRLD